MQTHLNAMGLCLRSTARSMVVTFSDMQLELFVLPKRVKPIHLFDTEKPSNGKR